MRPRVTCPHCHSDVDHLSFCGVCGRELPGSGEISGGRLHRIPLLGWLLRLPPYRLVALLGGIAIVVSLLAGLAGLAIAIASVLIPILATVYLTKIDIYEREPWVLLLGVAGVGAIVGLIAGWLGSLAFEQFWFDTSPFNVGAAAFSGTHPVGDDAPPILVILVNGIVISLLAAAATLAGPISLRRIPAFRNEVMDGVTLGAAAAGGFAAATSIVYFWPVFFDDIPNRSVQEWAAALTTMALVRPLVLAFSGSLLGAAYWHYALTHRRRDLVIPFAAGIIGWVGLTIGSLFLIPSGATWQLGWALVVLLIVFGLFREAVRRGLALDRRALTGFGDRIVCPNCHRVTPAGAFCSFCRADLRSTSPVAISDAANDAGVRERNVPPSVVPIDVSLDEDSDEHEPLAGSPDVEDREIIDQRESAMFQRPPADAEPEPAVDYGDPVTEDDDDDEEPRRPISHVEPPPDEWYRLPDNTFDDVPATDQMRRDDSPGDVTSDEPFDDSVDAWDAVDLRQPDGFDGEPGPRDDGQEQAERAGVLSSNEASDDSSAGETANSESEPEAQDAQPRSPLRGDHG